MKEFLVKNKKIVLITTIILILIIVGFSIFLIYNFISKKDKMNEVSNSNYSFQYDNTWEIVKKDEWEADLVHKKSKSELKIKINELEDEMQYKTIDEIFDSLLYNIQKQNDNYKLIYKEQANITKNELEGYKILFETNENQVAIYLYKQGNRLVMFTYEATYGYFDILLDSVNNIIYNFKLNETNFDVKTHINIETKEIEYREQSDVSNLLNSTKDDEIVNSNYLVQYSIPSNFKAENYSSEYRYYSFENLSDYTNIELNISILNRNIYEYLDREDTLNIYENYRWGSYNKENGVLDRFSENPLSYIYKNEYLKNNKLNENISIVFELNQNHIFIVDIFSEGIGIPKELVEMIKIKDIKNIASNVRNEKEDGFLIGQLKQYTDYSHKQTQEITLKLPESYQEIDKETNLYEERNYISNYYDGVLVPEYEVEYRMTSLSIDSELKILEDHINKNLGEFKNFSQSKDIISNDKRFIAYDRGYTQLSDMDDSSGNTYKYYTNEKVLFYDLQNDKYLVIIIKANENEIKDELINELTNFVINIK